MSPRAATKLSPVEEALRREFIPALFGRRMEVTSNDHILYANSVKAGGLGIRDPCHEAGSLNETSKVASGTLVTALVEGTDLSLVGHKKTVQAASGEARTAKRRRRRWWLLSANLGQTPRRRSGLIGYRDMGHGSRASQQGLKATKSLGRSGMTICH